MRSRFWIAVLIGLALVLDNAVWAEARVAAVDESGMVAQSPLLTQSGAPQSGSPATLGMDLATTLSGANEVPPVDTPATARSTISVGADRTVTGSVETTGIEGTAAHIHLGAVGRNGPVLVVLSKWSVNQWAVPAGTTLTEEQYASYKSGNQYVNVHSAAYVNGEIRLQLKP